MEGYGREEITYFSVCNFLGFTSGTGADWGNHDILYWEYRDEFDPIGSPIHEPTSLLMLGMRLGALGLVACRRRKK